MILQLNPSLPVRTPKGPAIAHFLIDTGLENDLQWVCFQDGSGECWTWSNRDVRAQKNITAGRDYISPFYEPEDMALPKNYYVLFEIGPSGKVRREGEVDTYEEAEKWVQEEISAGYNRAWHQHTRDEEK